MNTEKIPNIKAVFFDIDGILFSFKSKSIPESTKIAIKKLREKVIKVIVVTGRSINDLHHVESIEFDGFMTFNGGYCSTVDGKVMFRHAIHPEDIKNLIQYSEQSDVCFSMMYEDKVRISHAAPKVLKLYDHVNIPVPPIYDRDSSDVEDVMQANVFIDPQDEVSFMNEVMPNSLSSRWTGLFADVNPSGISKRRGVEKVLRAFQHRCI